jgi:uncharacterized protein
MPEPITAAAPRSVPLPVMRQSWSNVVFVHWETDPAAARAWLPDGVELDVWRGRAFAGLVGLEMNVAAFGLLPVPYLGSFPEVNVRVYSVDRHGRRGTVFCSMDAGRFVPALMGRVGYRLPYSWAAAQVMREGPHVTYRIARRWPGPAKPSTRLTVRVGSRISRPSALEQFLTARWKLHWAVAGRTCWSAVEHQPWPLYRADLDGIDDQLLSAAGLATPTSDPVSVLWSPGVRASIGPPRNLNRPS